MSGADLADLVELESDPLCSLVLLSTAFSRYQNHGGLTMRFFGLTWVPETIVPSWLAIFSLSTGGA